MSPPTSAEWRAVVLVASLMALCVEAQRPAPWPKELAWAEGMGNPLMITPNVMTGILVGAVWRLLFLTGFCCLFGVQTPSADEEKCLVLDKQNQLGLRCARA